MRSKLARFFAAVATIGVLAGGLSACSGSPTTSDGDAEEGERIPIRIGVPASNYWPAYVARDLDLYRQAGLEPEIVSFTSGAPLIAALESGSIDAVFTGLASLFAVQQGIELTYLATPLDSSSQEGLVVPPGSPISSFHDLAPGMTIGVPHASCAHISAISAVQAAGLDPGDVTISNLDPSVLAPALQRGEIDATFIWGPWSIGLEAEGNSIVSYDADYQGGVGLCPTNIAIRPAAEAEHPGISCRLMVALKLALEAAEADPSLGPAVLKNELGLTDDVAQRTYETLRIPTLDEQLSEESPFSLVNPSGGLAAQLSSASSVLVEAGVFTTELTTDETAAMIDAGPLADALDDGQCSA